MAGLPLTSYVSSIMTPSSIRLELLGIDPVRTLGAEAEPGRYASPPKTSRLASPHAWAGFALFCVYAAAIMPNRRDA